MGIFGALFGKNGIAGFIIAISEKWEDAFALNAVGMGQADRVEDCRGNIDDFDKFIALFTRRDVIGPGDDEWDMCETIVEGFAFAYHFVLAEVFAVIGHVDDQSVFAKAKCVHVIEQPAHFVIDIGVHAVIQCSNSADIVFGYLVTREGEVIEHLSDGFIL